MFCAWMAFLFDFFTILVCVFLVFLFFCDRAILGGLKTSVVQDYGRKIRTEEKLCSVARASLYLKLLFFPNTLTHSTQEKEMTRRVWTLGMRRKRSKIKKKRRNARLNAQMKEV